MGTLCYHPHFPVNLKLFYKIGSIKGRKSHPERCGPLLGKPQNLVSRTEAGTGPIRRLGWSHPASTRDCMAALAPPPHPQPRPSPQARSASRGLSLPSMPRKIPSLFLYRQVDLNLEDLFSGTLSPSPPQPSSCGRKGVGKSIPPSDPWWTHSPGRPWP